MSEKLATIILAAGLGKRMGSTLPKVAVSTRQMPLLLHVLSSVEKLSTDRVVVVTGHQRELVEKIACESSSASKMNLRFAVQEKQLGTGDAVKSALPDLENFTGSVLILCGDTPLISSATLSKFLDSHQNNKATISLISFKVREENGYGRIVRNPTSLTVEKIVEAKDCSPEQLRIEEVNSGIYLVDSSFLDPAIKELKNENKQKEYYLTDILERASKEGQTIHAMVLENKDEVLGVNTAYDLSIVNKALIMKKIRELTDQGVIFDLPESCIVDPEVEIAAGVRVGPNIQILGKSKIARNCILEGSAYIKNSSIGENSHIKFSVRMEDVRIDSDCSVGPFANLRPDTVLGKSVRIGNFVETKKAILADGAKANHLTYLGDCTVGENSNIGAGTITCNYDGYVKSKTTIGRNVFIGSNSALVAPVSIEDGATVGAGSVITKKVEKDSLAFTRSPQQSKSGWSKAKRDSQAKKS